jgi:hypothetical protein
MRFALAVLIGLHGVIHLLGFAKAWGLAELAQLSRPISRPAGVLWLLCAAAFLSAAILLWQGHGSWWRPALPAVAVSEFVILLAWRDARFGTIANLILVLPVMAAYLETRPASYGNRFRAAVREELARVRDAGLVTEEDLNHLPPPVRNYVVFTGAVGKPRIHNFRAVFEGEFRNGLDSPWMKFTSEQYNFVDPPARLFRMRASRYGIPMEALHMFRGDAATMQIKVASLLQVVDARGAQMNQAETVTLLNDMCLLAPAALIDRERILWETDGPFSAVAKFSHLGITVTARLEFAASGELTGFVSNDRFLSTDGKHMENLPWSTPVKSYREVAGRRVAGYGEAVWLRPEGEFTYGKFRLVTIEYNLPPAVL